MSPPSGRSSFKAPASDVSLATRSPIFDAMTQLRIAPKPTPRFISLAIGDPTVFGNLKTPGVVVEAVREALETYRANGYTASEGPDESRNAVAKLFSSTEFQLTKDDVFLANGASGALHLAIRALCPRNTNILLPRPGFTYCLSVPTEVECRYYDCMPQQDWEVDLQSMEALIDENTSAILINNPSNPCASNFTRKHLQEILALAERNFLPIISDEVYAGMQWTQHPFTALYSIPSQVPIITISGLAKRFLVPGWRIGWGVFHDRGGVFKDVRRGVGNLSQIELHPNSIVQAALPKILATPQDYLDSVVEELKQNAKIMMEGLATAPGLRVSEPQGAMYAIIGLEFEKWKDVKDTHEFVQKLVDEENVLCLPGECFFKAGFVRLGIKAQEIVRLTIVISHPGDILKDACDRITQFCKRHEKQA